MTIRVATQKGKEECDLAFAREVKERSQSHLERCYQCFACSSGCPVAYAMDYTPHQIIRMVQLGLKKGVLDSSTIWLCASCETCATRCPNDIDIVSFMDTLRHMAIGEERTRATYLPLFHAVFLNGIKSNGKIHELALIVWYMLLSGDIFNFKKLPSDMILGAKMFLRRKLAIFPARIKGLADVKRIFKMIERE